MALTGAMSAGISGLKTHMEALNVVGNNIANVNTYGYKPGRVIFSESMYSTQDAGSGGTATVGSTNPKQTGYGCSIGTIDLDMSTQSLENTGIATDLFIQGDGFFLVGPKNVIVNSAEDAKALSLSRVGDFEFGPDGYLTDGHGNVVYGFLTCNVDENGELLEEAGTNGSGVSTALVPIRLPLKHEGANVDDPEDPGYIAPGTAVYPGVDQDSGRNINPENSANSGAVENQFVQLESVSIDANGMITGVNSDTGDPVVVGYVALGNVVNPGGLQHTEGPYFTAGDAAGTLTIGTPNSSIPGYLNNQDDLANGNTDNLEIGNMLLANNPVGLQPGFLEASGTDLAQEFANMIVYQRGYQANTRIVTVTDTMLEELVNMKR